MTVLRPILWTWGGVLLLPLLAARQQVLLELQRRRMRTMLLIADASTDDIDAVVMAI